MSVYLKKLNPFLLLIIGMAMIQGTYAQFPVSYIPKNCRVGWPFRIEMSYDSGLLVTGGGSITEYDTAAEIAKLDVNGVLQWYRTFNSRVNNQDVSVKNSKDGGYFVFGSAYLTDTSGDAYICKLNPCGELEWGHLFKIPEWNWINDVIEYSDTQLLLVQSGNSFFINSNAYSHVGLFNPIKKQYTKQRIIPVEDLTKKTGIHNGRFYNFCVWRYEAKNDSTLSLLGSAQVSYDSALSNFQIRYTGPETSNDTFPLIWTSPLFLPNQKMIAGGSILGLRENIGYPLSFAVYDKNLYCERYIDMGHVRTPFCAEEAEILLPAKSNQFICIVNSEPNHNYSSTFNCLAEVYLIDDNFKEVKSIAYGDTGNYKYRIYDAILDQDSNLLLLMHKYKNISTVQYEIAKYDRNLNPVTTVYPPKRYDYKCPNAIDSSGVIDLLKFDTIVMKDWQIKAKNTLVSQVLKPLDVKIYPNPAQSCLNIQLPTPVNAQVQVYNALGQLIYSYKLNEQSELSLDLSALGPQVLLIRIETESQVVSKTVVIER